MYYPLSQIKTNLYATQGENLIVASTGEPYVGYYYETSVGEKYKGKSPQGSTQILLIKSPYDLPDDIQYNNNYVRVATWMGDADPVLYGNEQSLNQLTTDKYNAINNGGIPPIRTIPIAIRGEYNEEDQKRGYYMRYFTKRHNNYLYYEISHTDYNLLEKRDPTIAFDLYGYCSISWDLINLLANGGKANIIESNKKWLGFSQYASTLSSYFVPTLDNQLSPNPLSLSNSSFGGVTSGGGGGGY